MRRLSFAAFILLVPFTAYMLTGCGGGTNKTKHSGGGETNEQGGGDETKTVLKTDGTATLKGRVTFDGPRPMPMKIAALIAHKDCQGSPPDQQIDRTWMVSEKDGLRDVVIWVEPPTNKYFKLSDAEKKPKEKVVKLQQPHCEFIPHVLVMFPSYYDGKDIVQTGQVLEVVNNAKVTHNTNIMGDPRINDLGNKVLPPGDTKTVKIKAQEKPLNVKCDVHPFMHGKILALDTPFYAKTDADGNYEIKDVPAGAKVRVLAWHEDLPHEGYVLPQSGPTSDGEMVTLKKGETRELNFKVKK